MKFMDILKGKYNVWTGTVTDAGEVRFRATIYNDKDDIEFIGWLGELGIDIVGENNGKLDVLLPDRWLGVDINRHITVITDNLGRNRLISSGITKSSIILKRYSHDIIIMEDDEDVIFAELALIDNTLDSTNPKRVVDTVTISEENMNRVVLHSDYDVKTKLNRETFLLNMQISMENVLDVLKPGWKDPTKYWDE